MDVLALPSLNKHVTDYSGVLSSEQAELLSAKFAEHENTTTEQVLTVLIPHRQWHELLEIGLKLFNENGIGQKDLNNGLLLIVSTEEKKLRIITGKGMEIKYSEMVCREIVEKQLRPLLDAGEYRKMIELWFNIITHPVAIKKIRPESFARDLDKKVPGKYLLVILALFLSPLIWIFFPQSNIGFWIFMLVFGLTIGTITVVVSKKYMSSIRNPWMGMVILMIFMAALFTYMWTGLLRCSIQNNCPSLGGASSYSSSSSSSYDSSSSSSSYGGGGGSSNGGGYGD